MRKQKVRGYVEIGKTRPADVPGRGHFPCKTSVADPFTLLACGVVGGLQCRVTAHPLYLLTESGILELRANIMKRDESLL
jgi:hypothetical protein